MNPMRIVGIGLLVVGVILLVVGINASDSVADSFSHFFTGKYTNSTAWYMYGGVGMGVVGLLLAAAPFGKGSHA